MVESLLFIGAGTGFATLSARTGNSTTVSDTIIKMGFFVFVLLVFKKGIIRVSPKTSLRLPQPFDSTPLEKFLRTPITDTN